MITFNPANKKTMLTIDGGGARGIIPLMSLVKLEQLTGRTCHDLFDFVGGTSVGALIAAGIAAGRSAVEMVELYEKFIHMIFKKDYMAIAFKHGLRYIYDKEEMRRLLLEYVGDMTLAELDRIVFLTVKDMARAETIFFVNQGKGGLVTKDFPLATVAEASASAPIYFEPVGDAVDGGVGTFATVCYAASVEAMEYLSREDPDWRDGNVIHCSFGTGASVKRLRRGEARQWLPLGWPLWIIGEALQEAGEINVQFTMRHYAKRLDFRRYEVSLLDEVVRKELGVTIPGGLITNNLGMDSASPQEVDVMKAIGMAYADGLDFTMSGQQLVDIPPAGYGGYPYLSRLPKLTSEEIGAMFAGKEQEDL